jgi:hypothetical protein
MSVPQGKLGIPLKLYVSMPMGQEDLQEVVRQVEDHLRADYRQEDFQEEDPRAEGRQLGGYHQEDLQEEALEARAKQYILLTIWPTSTTTLTNRLIRTIGKMCVMIAMIIIHP